MKIATILHRLIIFTTTFLLYSHALPLEVTVTTHLGAGFFAEVLKVVDNLLHVENEDVIKFNVDWTQEFFPYKDGLSENGWYLYFKPIEAASRTTTPAKKYTVNTYNHELHDQTCSNTWTKYEKHLEYRKMAYNIMQKHIKIKENILEIIEKFYQENMANYTCIGVHVRFANAHSTEVPGGQHPSLNDYTAEVDTLLKKHAGSPIKIFLATDSHAVINHFKNIYPDSILLYIDAFRATNSQDPSLIYENAQYWLSHPEEFHKHKPGFQGGLTTLLDGMLLSKCNYLIHTTSNVATFASFINPSIESVYLPKNIPLKECYYSKHSAAASNIKNKWHLNL